MQVENFIIRHRHTGWILPAAASGQSATSVTLADPRHAPPRLFRTGARARRALTYWLKGWGGVETGTDEDAFGNKVQVQIGVTYLPDASRRREDMEVVPVTVDLPLLEWEKSIG